mgnify:CR=1 FL=1
MKLSPLLLLLALVLVVLLSTFLLPWSRNDKSCAQLTDELHRVLLRSKDSRTDETTESRLLDLDAKLHAINSQLGARLDVLTAKTEEAHISLKDTIHEQLQQAPAVAADPTQAAEPVIKQAASESRDIVVGMASGIPYNTMYRMVRSLRTHAPKAHLLIFIGDSDAQNREMVQMLKDFRAEHRVFTADDLPREARAWHPSSQRWVLFREHFAAALKRNGNRAPYDRLWFVDVRDTVFQRDPFAIMDAPGFYAFQEKAQTTIAECGWNGGWVRDCWGDAMLQQIGAKYVSCSGTSAATWDDAWHYLNFMADEIAARAQCERNGIDQGMHNVYVFANYARKLRLFTNEHGPVATVQGMLRFRRDAYGRLINEDDEPYHVVHQYDRSEKLKQQYAREYVEVSEHERDGH